MSTTYWLKITLKSDTAFTRGDGVPGLVNAEVQHDSNGLPFLGGKTLKGLLSAACAEVISAVEQSKPNQISKWKASAGRLFGQPGGGPAEAGYLHMTDAHLPDDLRSAIALDIKAQRINREQVLASLTTLRTQTAMSAETGAPVLNSLRTTRVIMRETVFSGQIEFLPLLAGRQITKTEQEQDLALLAACIKALRRAGAHRNRGLGKVQVELYEQYSFLPNSMPITDQVYQPFRNDLSGKQEGSL